MNAEMEWTLDADQQQIYVSALLEHLGDSDSETNLRRMVMNYHLDHVLLQALQDRQSLRHEVVWADVVDQVVRMVIHQRHGQATEVLMDVEDLSQIALEALLQALPSFHYASRFSTWTYSVIARSIQRYVRHLRAAKRHGHVESAEQHPELNTWPAKDEEPEAKSEASALAALIETVLTELAGDRLARIFRLSVSTDQRLSEIGRQVQLSPSRVSVLIEQARQLLQQSPEIQAWLGTQDDDRVNVEPAENRPGHTK